MNAPLTAFHIVVLAGSTAITAGLAAYAWRQTEHGTRPFVALMAVFTLYSGAQLVGLLTFHEPLRLVLDKIQWVGTALIPLFWILFAMEYTGVTWFLTRTRAGLLSVVPLLTVAFVWSNQWHGLMWTVNTLDPVAGLALLDQEFGPWFWVYVAYTYGCIIVGAALLVRLAWLSEQLYVDQSLLLVVGAVAPLGASVLTVLGVSPLQNPTLDMTPYAFVVTGLTFGYAVFRHRLFDIIPATRQLGRRSAIQDLEEGIVIVDTDRNIVYCNPAAADLLDTTPEALLGRSMPAVLPQDAIDFTATDARSTLERDSGVYEVRTSPVRNRRDSLVGHTLVISDITERTRRERQLKQQRTELEWLEDLNSVIRGINRVLTSATTREDIERAVCDHLADSRLYQTACVADIPTWCGEADRWTIAGDKRDPRELTPLLRAEDILADDEAGMSVSTADDDAQGSWAIIPLVYRRTAYGALGLYTHRTRTTEAGSSERTVLTELGSIIGHAINAVENRQLLSPETTVELELRSSDDDAPLLDAARETGCQLCLSAIVTDGQQRNIAYIEVNGTPDQAAAALAAASAGETTVIEADDHSGLIEWRVPDQSFIGFFAGRGLNVVQLTTEPGHVSLRVEAPSEKAVRRLVDDLQHVFPETQLAAKRQQEPRQTLDGTTDVSETTLDDLTDRQREVLEIAYRAGYFEWPRQRSAEEIADTLDISRPTVQAHLRKAEETVFTNLFDS